MGMDPKTQIWIGFESEDVLEQLPDEIRYRFEDDGEIETPDVLIETFYIGGEVVGLGAKLLEHSYGPDELNLSDLVTKAAELKPKVRDIFASWGVDDEPGVLLASDYS